MPLGHEWFIVLPILPLMPGRCRGEPFLSQSVHGDDPIATSLFARIRIREQTIIHRVHREAGDRLPRPFNARAATCDKRDTP